MKAAMPLTPFGTARRALGEPAEASLPPYPQEIAKALLGHDLAEETLCLAWEIVRCVADLSLEEQRALLLLVCASLVTMRQGSTRLPIGRDGSGPALRAALASLGATEVDFSRVRDLLAHPARLDTVMGDAPGERPLVRSGGCLYAERMLGCENAVVAALLARRHRVDEPPSARAVEDVLARPPVHGGTALALSEEQRAAVVSAVRAPLTVISGGPGTGKTSVVVSLLRVLARCDVRMEKVALAAPTGKAAQRMEDAVQRGLSAIAEPAPEDVELRAASLRAQTLHRLLGYSPRSDRFFHHENNRLLCDYLIVDEGSMIDLFLFERLLRALRDDAHLVLLGDADQLPSVDVGAVFREILPSGEPADPRAESAVRLTHNFRVRSEESAGRNILSVARAVNEGDADAACAAVVRRGSAAAVHFEGVELVPAAERTGLIARWYEERLRADPRLAALTRKVYTREEDGFGEADTGDLRALFAEADRRRILCVTRDLPGTGAGALNEILHRRVLERARRGEGEMRGVPAFYPGEPILIQENDYERGLFNGDQGLVLRVAEGDPRAPHRFMAVFPQKEGFGVYSLDTLRPVAERSFAITVHKSQGSEFDEVLLVLPDEDIPLLSRELLYTAVSRSRRSVVIVGREEVLRRGVERRVERFSGIAEKLLGGG
jgi:exodeoxyribonuclease V alpha subunit